MENKVTFERKLGSKGGVMAVSIPIELQEYLEIESGDTLQMYGELGSKGKYIAIWKKKEE